MSWRPWNLPDLSGRVLVVTGANSGIGLRAAWALAGTGAHVVLACRNPNKGEAALAQIRAEHAGASVELMTVDLSDLGSVRAFATSFRERHETLDVLVNNAGVMALPYQKTADGFEMQLGTNHLGHFALSGLLLPALLASPSARVVTLSSAVHRFGRIRFEDLQAERSYHPWTAYAQSKLANLLFCKELARRAASRGLLLTSVACHPGYASTNLQTVGARMTGSPFKVRFMRWANGAFAQSADMGALPTLYAATAEGLSGGDFIGPSGPLGLVGPPRHVGCARRADDPEVAARLWEESERLTGTRFDALDA